MSRRLPYFRCYAPDLVDRLAGLPLQARGLYLTLLCRQWIDGQLPMDEQQLARAARIPAAQFRASWAHIAELFPEVAPGVRANPDLAEQREVATAKGDAAKAAAEARWDKWRASKGHGDADALLTQSTSNATKSTTNPKQTTTQNQEQEHGPLAPTDSEWTSLATALAAVGPVGVPLLRKHLGAFITQSQPLAEHGFALLVEAAGSYARFMAALAPEEQGFHRHPWAFFDKCGVWLEQVRPEHSPGAITVYDERGEMTLEAARALGISGGRPGSVTSRTLAASAAFAAEQTEPPRRGWTRPQSAAEIIAERERDRAGFVEPTPEEREDLERQKAEAKAKLAAALETRLAAEGTE